LPRAVANEPASTGPATRPGWSNANRWAIALPIEWPTITAL